MSMAGGLLPHQRWWWKKPLRRRNRMVRVFNAHLEVPDPPFNRRVVVSQALLEVPNAPRRARLTFAELEVPPAPVSTRRARITFAAFEVPSAARRARVSFAALEVPDDLISGAFARRESQSTLSWQAGTGASSQIATLLWRWQNYETAEGVYNSSYESQLVDSIDDAHEKGYKIVLRVFAGSDAPCGRPSDGSFPGWMLSGSNPVEVITTKANDSGGGVTEGDLINIPLAWDANYRYHYRRLLSRLATLLSANDSFGHPRKAHILFVPAAMPTELGTEMTLGYGSLDPTFNQGAWDSVSTQTERRTWYRDAWKTCIDDHRELLPGIRVGLAGGHLFLDGWAGADDIVQTKAGSDLVCMTTSLKDDYVNLHPNDHDFLLKGKAAGCFMGIQTASTSKLPHGQPLVSAAEFALSTYGIHFFETQPDRFTSSTVWTLSPTGGWPGADVTMKTYLVEHASDLQSRLVK